MSQSKVLQVMKDIGGHGRIADITQRAKEKYPQYSLYLY